MTTLSTPVALAPSAQAANGTIVSIDTPRILVFVRVLKRSLAPVVLASLAVIAIGALVRVIVADYPYPTLYKAESFIDLATVAMALIYLLRKGFARLAGLKGGREPEVYLTVFAIGVSVACLSSATSYSLYRIGAAQYELDPSLVQQTQRRVSQKVVAADSELHVVDTLLVRLQRGTGPITLSVVRKPWWQTLLHSGDVRGARVPELGDWSIQVATMIAGGARSPPFFSFSSPNHDDLHIEPEVSASDTRLLMSPNMPDEFKISRESLVAALKARSLDAAAIRNIEARAYLTAPLGIFLYQGTMTFLGANPKYLTPVGLVAQVLAVLGATFRLVYAALVLSMFVKKWTEPNGHVTSGVVDVWPHHDRNPSGIDQDVSTRS